MKTKAQIDIQQMASDWQTCKAAHTAATQMHEAQGKWRPDTVQPWMQDLAEKATSFKSRYGTEFNPNQPI